MKKQRRNARLYESQEKYAEAMNGEFGSHIKTLQKALDAYCEKLQTEYMEENRRLAQHYYEEVQKEAATGILSQCYPYGISPQTQVFLAETSRLSQTHASEMREVRAIYDTLGLRTNHHLEGFPLHNAPMRRCALQDV